jgi:simple sugar transport system permease protein
MAHQGESSRVIAELLASTARVSTPLIFAALGGLISERAGVINIALEGMMLIGAFAAAAGTLAAGTAARMVLHAPELAVLSPWVGAAAGVLAGMAIAGIYGFFAIRLRSNQIVAGTAINMLALGLTPFLCKLLYGQTGSTDTIPSEERFHIVPIYACWLLAIVCFLWFKHTRGGLWLSFAGENPEALAAAGIRVNRVRWFGVLCSGALAGLGGAALSIFLSSRFSRDMTAGRGFMALAALIFGKWKPIPTALACLLFGFCEAVQIRLQGAAMGGVKIPVQFIQILPYVVTVLVLAGFVGRSRAPKALGVVFRRE